MAITDSGSVLILGAGVSAPFGLSLGGDMISEVSKAIRKEIDTLNGISNGGGSSVWQILSSAVYITSEFNKFPIHCTIAKPHFVDSYARKNPEVLLKKLVQLESLEKLLDDQTSETIDDFIVENPSYANLTKICIASLFVQSCYDFEAEEANVKPFSNRRFPPNSANADRNWVHLLINIVRQGIRSGSVSADNKVTIVTFNYDKILEYILEKQFSNTEASYGHYSEYVEIIHVHGQCGDLQNALSNRVAAVCRNWAKGIHVVNEENVPDNIVHNRNLAQIVIGSANEIYCCGFSFSGPNCRLLGLDVLSGNAGQVLISYCNYDGNVGISKTVKKLENLIVTVEESAGSIDRCLGVSDWLMQGHLGELPG